LYESNPKPSKIIRLEIARKIPFEEGNPVFAKVSEESSVVLTLGVDESSGTLVRFVELSVGIVVSTGGSEGLTKGVELSFGTPGAVIGVELSLGTVVAGGTTGSVVSVGIVVSVGTEGTVVSVGVGSMVTGGVVGTTGEQSGEVITFVSKVTAPLRAKALPSILAPVVAVMEVRARMLPLKVDAVPNVAELPTCQNTLHAEAPLIRLILLFEAVVKVDPT
jgi:hypothetical protein